MIGIQEEPGETKMWVFMLNIYYYSQERETKNGQENEGNVTRKHEEEKVQKEQANINKTVEEEIG